MLFINPNGGSSHGSSGEHLAGKLKHSKENKKKDKKDSKREPSTKQPLKMGDLSSPLLAEQGEESNLTISDSKKRIPEQVKTDTFAKEAKFFFTSLPTREDIRTRIDYLNKFKRAITKEIHQMNIAAPSVESDSDGSESADIEVIDIKDVEDPCLSKKQVLFIMLIIFVTVGTTWFVIDEGNSFIDALYMVIIIITTVGYGMDDFMEDDRNQIFLIFYIVFGVALITTFLNIMFVGMLDGLAKKQLRFFDAEDSDCFTATTVSDDEDDQKCCGFCSANTWESFVNVMSSTTMMIAIWILTLLGGSFGIGAYEDWDGLRCVYFAIVSGSTVGFGDFAPESQEGKMICIIWLPVCIALTANAFGTIFSGILGAFFDETMNELASLQDICEDLLNEDNFEENLELMDIDGDGELTESEFITQTLINEYAVPPQKLQLIKAYFQELDVDRGGSITIEDFKEAIKRKKAKAGKKGKIERVNSGGEEMPENDSKKRDPSNSKRKG